MPMQPYQTIDFGSRVSALIAVGKGLGVPNNQLPAPTASPGDIHNVVYMNALYAKAGLPLLSSLDFSSFTSALNAAVAKVP